MQRKGPRRDVGKERFWRETVRRQQRSGRSVREFCGENGLSEPSFYAWRRELRRRAARTAHPQTGPRAIRPAGRAAAERRPVVPRGRRAARMFVPVRVAAAASAAAAPPVELAFPGGAVLRWPAGVEPASVAAIVSAWERSRC